MIVNPYATPKTKEKASGLTNYSTRFQKLMFVAALLSVWYLAIDCKDWFSQSEYATSAEMYKTWLARTVHAIPKLGMVLGYILVIKKSDKLLHVFIISWLVGLVHTMVIFGMYSIEFSTYEYWRMTVHHIIPHSFFILVIFYLLRENQRQSSIKSF